jgi:hypothetical protein
MESDLRRPPAPLRKHVTFPLYLEVDQIYNLAWPTSPIHYQRDPVQTTKTGVHGAINMLGLAKRLVWQTRSFCYVDDLVEGLILMMATADGVVGPITLGSPNEFTTLEPAAKVIELTGSRSRIVHRPKPQDDRGSGVRTFPRRGTSFRGRRALLCRRAQAHHQVLRGSLGR